MDDEYVEISGLAIAVVILIIVGLVYLGIGVQNWEEPITKSIVCEKVNNDN